MKITFVRPNFWAGKSSDAMQPLAYAYLAALTPPDDEILLLDERLESIDFDCDADLVAISVETYTAKRAYEIAEKFRRRGVPVVMGGYHPTLIPEEASRHADAIVIGDAEGLWEQVVEDTRRNCLQPVYSQEQDPPLGGVIPDRKIFRGKNYSRLVPVNFGRGCRYACDFCSIYSFYDGRQRQRPLDELVAEIAELGSKYILFVDDNLFVNRAMTLELLSAIAPLNIKWACQVSVDIVKDPAILDRMAESGCVSPLIGFESLSSENLKQMKKGWNLKYGDFPTVIKQIQQRGMMIYGTFVLGYDHDTKDSIKATLDFALEHKFCIANFNPLTPMPGAKLYDRLRKEGRLLYDKWWLDPRFKYGDATFYPKGMTPDELTEGCYRARTEFGKYSSIFRRALETGTNARNPRNLGMFLLSNYISRKEIHTKQGRRLGSVRELPIPIKAP